MVKLLAALVLMLAAGAWAQDLVDGEVRKVDKAQGKVTLKHGEIKNLEMPAMTMAYRVKDTQMLEGLVEGARVKFAAQKVNGQFTVTRIQPAK